MQAEQHKKTNLKNRGLFAIAMALSFISMAFAGYATTFWTMDEVNTHNSASDCWMVIDGKVYDMTSYIPSHPGGSAIIPFCGLDATDAFAGQPMHSYAIGLLPIYYIGDLAVPDTTAPVIVMDGISPVEITVGSVYTDAGATATDDVDPVVTVNAASTVDTTAIGSYTVTYTATDSAGNPATPVIRTVNVVAAPDTTEPDTIPPTVTIVSPVNTTYTNATISLEYTAVDNANGSGVNMSACSYGLDSGAIMPLANCGNIMLPSLANGTHTVTVYSADNSGNTGSATVSFSVNATATEIPPHDNGHHKGHYKGHHNKHNSGAEEQDETDSDEDDDEDSSEELSETDED